MKSLKALEGYETSAAAVVALNELSAAGRRAFGREVADWAQRVMLSDWCGDTPVVHIVEDLAEEVAMNYQASWWVRRAETVCPPSALVTRDS